MDFLAAYAPLLWTVVFCLLLTAGLLTRLWLAGRQMRHVAQHRASVPAAFAERIGLAAHQKAANYTIAKTRLGLLEGSFGAALLIGWTLLGGLNALNLALLAWLGPGLLQQVALLAAFTALGALLELPLSWYRTFVLEQQHGFNRMTPRLWLSDGLKGPWLGRRSACRWWPCCCG